MPPETDRNRQIIRDAVDWWERDRSRLIIIRIVALGLFVASAGGSIYAGITGTLPVWGLTLYVFFTVQLVFMTFMYAIRHSGEAEIRRAVFDLRRARLSQWQIERDMLNEYVRLTACQAANLDPAMPVAKNGVRRARAAHTKAPLPSVPNKDVEARRLVRAALTRDPSELDGDGDGAGNDLVLEFVAYSSETLIELSREMVAEIDDVLSERDARFEANIKVRILIRDTSSENGWLVPLAKDERADEEYGSDLRTRFRNVQRSALKEFEESLKALIPPRQVHFFVRGYLGEPLFKGVMVNGTAGMLGYYTVSELRDPDGWDYSGHSMDLCSVRVGGNVFEDAAAKFFHMWFDLMWDEPNSRTFSR